MSIFQRITNVIKRPSNPNEFVKRFIRDSRKKHCQLELYYKGEIILQVESLKHVPIIMTWINADKKKYENGFAVNFFEEKKKIKKSKIYANYLLAKEDLDMIEYDDKENELITFFKLFESDIHYMQLASYMRFTIEKVYKYEEFNPQILFNIRYLKIV